MAATVVPHLTGDMLCLIAEVSCLLLTARLQPMSPAQQNLER
jgi:hypothetical protein